MAWLPINWMARMMLKMKMMTAITTMVAKERNLFRQKFFIPKDMPRKKDMKR